MAVCTTPSFGGSTSPQVSLTVTASSSTATTVTLSWRLDYVAHGYAASTSVAKLYHVVIAGASVASGAFDINGITGTKTITSGTTTITRSTSSQNIVFSCSMAFNLSWNGTYGGTKSSSGSIAIAGKTSYTISYNANGGSGAPSSQTKWAGTSITLSNTKPTRANYTFKGWATSSTGGVVYSPGSTYSTDASVTLYAVWGAAGYTVSYDANGGSGAPSSQSKTYGVNLTLSSMRPTRSNYTFKGWGTSAASSTVAYAPGGTYSANASVTLYAIWEIGYGAPRITDFTVDRCTSNGILSESGTYAKVVFYWACDTSLSSIVVGWKLASSTSYTNETVSASGVNGVVSTIIGGGYLNPEVLYNIRVTVTDNNGSSSETKNLAQTKYIIDVLAGGDGIAFGKPAERIGMDIGMEMYVYGGKTLLDFVHPVNSIYISYSHTSPATLFGGTWERIEDAFLYAGNDRDNMGMVNGVDAGEDSIHSSMMPYIKVAMWRRIS